MVGNDNRDAKSAAANIDMHNAVSPRDSPAVSWFNWSNDEWKIMNFISFSDNSGNY